MFRLLGILLAGLLLPQAALAQGGGGPPSPDMMIKRQDANGDGKLSRDEFRGPPQRFDMMDADKDGFLTKEEITAFRAGGPGAKPGGPVGAGAGAMPWLNGDQVRKLMSGTEVSHVSPRNGAPMTMNFKADGTMDGTAGNSNTVTGAWQVRPDGQFCFDSSAATKTICFYLIRKGDKVQRLNNKKVPAPGIDWSIVRPGPEAAKVPDGTFR